LFGERNIDQSVLISSARFGGNYFVRAYRRSRASVRSLGEIFRNGSDNTRSLAQALRIEPEQVAQLAIADPVELWQRAKAAMPGYHLIAKLYYYHQPPTSPLWSCLATSDDYVLHLIRRNLFDAYISREIVNRYGLWNIRNAGELSQLSLHLTVNEADASSYIEKKLDEITQVRSMLSNKERYFEIFFEDIIHTPAACAAVSEHIYGERSTFRQEYMDEFRHRRIKRAPNSTIVKNYADVAHLDCMHVN
jgi:hypothetical protein